MVCLSTQTPTQHTLPTQQLVPMGGSWQAGGGRLGVWEEKSVSFWEACGLCSSPSSVVTARRQHSVFSLRAPLRKMGELHSAELFPSPPYSGSRPSCLLEENLSAKQPEDLL